jgi:hypothetical protein
MRNWLFRETRNFVKQPVSFAKQRNSFCIEFRETKSETSFAGNPSISRYPRFQMTKDSAIVNSGAIFVLHVHFFTKVSLQLEIYAKADFLYLEISVAEPEPHLLVGAITRCDSGSDNSMKHG